MKRVAFVDESGLKSPCHCVAVAVIVAEVRGSYLYWGLDVISQLRASAGVQGEIKWRLVKRRGLASRALALIGTLETHRDVHHYVDRESFETWLWRLLTGIKADLYVLDEGLADPRKFPRAVSKPSHKVPGIQLADLLAGYTAELFCKRSRGFYQPA
ncbi:MAG: DUF3800 domain-containing protein [Pyrobaculum sp.]|uniref:DUF3800 domain-containing protein n=1 Tax=Pyrobaculum sp. TaxID=2004705 RepID=UPI00317A8C03